MICDFRVVWARHECHFDWNSFDAVGSPDRAAVCGELADLAGIELQWCGCGQAAAIGSCCEPVVEGEVARARVFDADCLGRPDFCDEPDR